jgi:hypothetical protein
MPSAVRGSDEDCASPPHRSPAAAANAPGSSLGSGVEGMQRLLMT